MSRPAVFLDRDGVICQKAPEGDYIKDWSEFKWLPGAKEALKRLKEAGLCVVVISNQRGIALARYTAETVENLHNHLQEELGQGEGVVLDGFYFCPHDRGECNCRKPKPGLILQAAQDLDFDLGGSVLIGDSRSDVEAGHRAGVKTILLMTRSENETQGNPWEWQYSPDEVYPNLKSAVDALLTV